MSGGFQPGGSQTISEKEENDPTGERKGSANFGQSDENI